MSETKTREQASLEFEASTAAPLATIAKGLDLTAPQSEGALIDALQWHDEVTRVLERRASMLATVRNLAIRATEPTDWTLFAGDAGATALLGTAGAQRVASLFGIRIEMFPRGKDGSWAPVVEKLSQGEIALSASFTVRSRVLGVEYEDVPARKTTKESWRGRSVGKARVSDRVEEDDLIKSFYSGIIAAGVRIACGLKAVGVDLLEENGIDTSKCRKGGGYGSSNERRTEEATGGALVDEQKALADEVFARVGGDPDSAKRLMVEITTYGSRPGVDAARKIGKEAAIRGAWASLRKHPVFGDEAIRQPGES